MIARRTVLAAAGGLLADSNWARAGGDPRLSFGGSLQQGSLVIGKTVPGAVVAIDGGPVSVSPGGAFAFGFAYDRTKPVQISATCPDGIKETRALTAIVRQYSIQRVNGLPQAMVTPSPEDLERIRRENASIWEARKRDTEGAGFTEPFDWPFPGIISSTYGNQRVENGTPMAPHLGVDIAAPEGTPIHAPAGAQVSITDDYFLDGGFTLLDHGHGVSTCYLHQSKRMVAVGDKVKRGDVIGLVGKTGRATGPHTHWGLNWFQLKLDPSLSTRTPVPPRV